MLFLFTSTCPPGFLHIRRQKRQTHVSASFVQPIRCTLLGSGVSSLESEVPSLRHAQRAGDQQQDSSRTAGPLLWWGSWQLGSSPQCLPEKNCDGGMTSLSCPPAPSVVLGGTHVPFQKFHSFFHLIKLSADDQGNGGASGLDVCLVGARGSGNPARMHGEVSAALAG